MTTTTPDPLDARVNNANLAIRQLFDDVIQEGWREAYKRGYYRGEDAATGEDTAPHDLRVAADESYGFYCDSEDAVDVQDEQLNAVLRSAVPADATVTPVCACGHAERQHDERGCMFCVRDASHRFTPTTLRTTTERPYTEEDR